MTEYTLLWNGVLRSVGVPAGLPSERARWTWATVRLGGTEEMAWQAALSVDCPGLGWVTGAPRSFDSAVFGAAVTVADTSSSAGKLPSRTPTHMPPRPHRAQIAKSVGSGNAGLHRPLTQRPTSSASSHRGRGGGGAHPPSARPHATPHARPGTGGWMGRAATRPLVLTGAPPA
jgi:hypothetical protein